MSARGQSSDQSRAFGNQRGSGIAAVRLHGEDSRAADCGDSLTRCVIQPNASAGASPTPGGHRANPPRKPLEQPREIARSLSAGTG